MLPYILLAVVLLTFVHLLLNYNRRAVLTRKIPGIRDRFIVGDALDIIKTPGKIEHTVYPQHYTRQISWFAVKPVDCKIVALFRYLRDLANKHQGIYRFWCFPFGAVFIYNPHDIEKVLSSMKYHEKSELYLLLQPWLQDGLLLSSGAKWHNRRKILTPAFHFNVLRKYFMTFEENSHRLVKSLNNVLDIDLDIVPFLSEYTLNSICESAMGTSLTDERAGKSYKNAIYNLGRLLVHRLVRVYLYYDFIFNNTYTGKKQKKCLSVIHSFSQKVINDGKNNVEDKKKDLEENNEDKEFAEYNIYNKKKKAAMLDSLFLAEKDGLIDRSGIEEEVDTFIFEGHDTTASGLTFCLMLLANHPEIQDRIVAELKEIFGETKRATVIEDLASMSYLDRCIKETLRLYPSVPLISRKINEEVELSNYTVPAGTLCHILIYDLHHSEHLYPNPSKFDPDRFLPENVAKRHNYAYVPFSAGPRNCIGQKFAMMEMKLAVAAILRNFVLLPVTIASDLRFQVDLVLRNSGPVFVRFVKREVTI